MADKRRADESRTSTAGPGGDINFTAGRGGIDPDGRRASDGAITFFLADGTEVLRFAGDGDVFVRSERVDSNPEVYDAFQLWLGAAVGWLEPGATFTPNPGVSGG